MENQMEFVELQRVADVIDSLHQTPQYSDFGYPMVRVTDIKSGYLNTSTCLRVSKEIFKDHTKKYVPKQGDIVISRVGYYGITSYVNKKSSFCLGQNTAIIVPKINCRYLFYCFQSDGVKNQIEKCVVGSTQKTLSLKLIKELKIPNFDLKNQHQIASILGSLDDKIELNRQMNETLEAMVRVIFQSWFVDFDPVRAKAEGRDTVLPPEIAALFPDGFGEIDGREVPRGWRVGRLSEICEKIYSGGTPSTQNPEFWDGGIPWLSSGETRNRFITTTERTITLSGASNSSTRLVRPGATVIASAGQGHTRGQTSFLLIESYINQSTVALTANLKIISDSYLFFELSRRYPELRQISDSHSSRGSLTTQLLAQMDVLIPPSELVSKFNIIADPIVKQIGENLKESSTLAHIRDALLPKLISGEVSVK
jgi:type I restriction enzyme S subunit